MEKVLISACLLGERVRYDGGDAKVQDEVLQRWQQQGRLVPVCPEVEGSLPVPRPAAEIQADGHILTITGKDVTPAFEQGAEVALALCHRDDIHIAILKEGSPSCGSTQINDGTFSGTKISGQGRTAALLAANDVRVFSEQEIDKAAGYLADIEEKT